MNSCREGLPKPPKLPIHDIHEADETTGESTEVQSSVIKSLRVLKGTPTSVQRPLPKPIKSYSIPLEEPANSKLDLDTDTGGVSPCSDSSDKILDTSSFFRTKHAASPVDDDSRNTLSKRLKLTAEVLQTPMQHPSQIGSTGDCSSATAKTLEHTESLDDATISLFLQSPPLEVIETPQPLGSGPIPVVDARSRSPLGHDIFDEQVDEFYSWLQSNVVKMDE